MIDKETSNNVVYETQWRPKDEEKEYPHGWGFVPPLVVFPIGADPVECADFCRKELSNAEFDCIGAHPRKVFGFSPRNQNNSTV